MEVSEIAPAPTTPDGWEGVVLSVSPGLLRLALMLTGSAHDAEDLLQSSLAKACRHASRIATMDAPAAYLRRVLVNEHTSRHRGRRFATVPLSEVAEQSAAEADTTVERDRVWRWLATLPKQQRAVLVLRFYEDLPDDEIAALVGCSRATVRSHASHGLAALRTLLTNFEENS
jgi:RNA polymerase sigma-70 factor (sigma-E family)